MSVPKGAKERVVPVARETERFLSLFGPPRHGHVFVTQYGNPYRAGSVSGRLGRYLHETGIDATPHQLRHWFGTECYRRTEDLLFVQELMGHADPSTTRGYVALCPKPEAAQVVRTLSVRSIVPEPLLG